MHRRPCQAHLLRGYWESLNGTTLRANFRGSGAHVDDDPEKALNLRDNVVENGFDYFAITSREKMNGGRKCKRDDVGFPGLRGC